MESLNSLVNEYTKQLQKGRIQEAYRGIMAFMSALKKDMEAKHPEFISSALYFGYMDMTYFAFTPLKLKKKNLKIAVVYLHEQNRFEVWLAGSNRKVQAEYIEKMSHKNLGDYKLSKIDPGVDSIIEGRIHDQPDFDQTEDLMQQVESETLAFVKSILSLLNE